MREAVRRHPIRISFLLMLLVALPLMLSPIGYFPIRPMSGERIIVMDGRFSYDMPAVEHVFAQLGADGMAIYAMFHIGDCLFAAAYGLFGFAVAKAHLWKRSRLYCMLVSALPPVFDIAENISIRVLAASACSGLKRIVLALWLVSVLAAALPDRKRRGRARAGG